MRGLKLASDLLVHRLLSVLKEAISCGTGHPGRASAPSPPSAPAPALPKCATYIEVGQVTPERRRDPVPAAGAAAPDDWAVEQTSRPLLDDEARADKACCRALFSRINSTAEVAFDVDVGPRGVVAVFMRREPTFGRAAVWIDGKRKGPLSALVRSQRRHRHRLACARRAPRLTPPPRLR